MRIATAELILIADLSKYKEHRVEKGNKVNKR